MTEDFNKTHLMIIFLNETYSERNVFVIKAALSVLFNI